MNTTRYPPISEYAFLSDCHTGALLGPDGAVEWMCAPQFDAASVFTRLLDRRRGGAWEISVRDAAAPERDYVGDSLVLHTRWSTPTGIAVAYDFLAIEPPGTEPPGSTEAADTHTAGDHAIVAQGVLVRLVRCEQGSVDIEFRVTARPDYGSVPARWTHTGEGLTTAEHDGLWLSGEPAPHIAEDGTVRSTTSLTAGETAVLALGYDGRWRHRVDSATAQHLLDHTRNAWQVWADRSNYQGYAAEHVTRSAIVLRGLLFDRTGALLAAPTTSLPEWPGGERNWDYRYAWHRDAALVVLALLRLGHHVEAKRYLQFLLEHDAERTERLEPMLGIDGRTEITEQTVPHLEGYRGSSPVRAGNEAMGQHQLDTYGHILDAALAWHQVTKGLTEKHLDELRRIVDTLCQRWREPDHGIWEVRNSPRHWTNSKLFAWVCLDRGVRLAELCGDDQAPLRRWRAERDAVRAELLTHGYDDELGAFVQSYGARNLDASMLRLPLLGCVDAQDRRAHSTVDAIDAELGEGGWLVHRYDPVATDDGIGAPEGAFLLCSFDMVSALTLLGRTDDARKRFETLCAQAGRFGLFSEEMTADGTMLGNYPQAFTHLALIDAAMNLDHAGRHEALHEWADQQTRPAHAEEDE